MRGCARSHLHTRQKPGYAVAACLHMACTWPKMLVFRDARAPALLWTFLWRRGARRASAVACRW